MRYTKSNNQNITFVAFRTLYNIALYLPAVNIIHSLCTYADI